MEKKVTIYDSQILLLPTQRSVWNWITGKALIVLFCSEIIYKGKI